MPGPAASGEDGDEEEEEGAVGGAVGGVAGGFVTPAAPASDLPTPAEVNISGYDYTVHSNIHDGGFGLEGGVNLKF